MFTDRKEVGQMLARKLESYRGKNALVLALPRGGVVVGYEVAHELHLPLDLIAIRKIGHPSDPEYAIGAVDEKMTVLLDESASSLVDESWLNEKISRESKEAHRRNNGYRGERDQLNVFGKVVILVDDGVATGITMRLMVKLVRLLNPAKIIVAVGVISLSAVSDLEKEGANEVITLIPASDFRGSVGAHYLHFEQVEDKEVIKLMKQAFDEEQSSSRR